MGYRVLNVSAEMRERYIERSGLEGPFFYGANRVLYYSVREGRYYNPDSDMFLSYDEYVEYVGVN